MEQKDYAVILAAFAVSTAIGFIAGTFQNPEPVQSTYDERLDFTANDSNTIVDAKFDNRTIKLILRPGNTTEFYFEEEGEVKELDNIKRDGEVHEIRDIISIRGKTYLLYMRYNDDRQKQGDEWLKLYRVKEL